MSGRTVFRAGVHGLALLVLCSVGVRAQGLRGTATTTTRFVQVRPIVQDSIDQDQVTQLPDGTFEYRGQRLTCLVNARCVFYRAGDVQHALAVTQDVSFTAWGFGVRGLSATAYVRARSDVGGDFTWPRSDDAFDAMLLYLEYDREPYRVRLGRLQTLGGLGFSGYDGAHVLVEAKPGYTVEAYGGRSLSRGIAEPRNEALAGLESFLLDRNAWLLGAAATASPVRGTTVQARYQREIWSDRSGLLSERGSLDVDSDLLRPVRIHASADYDFPFQRIGKASVTARVPFGSAQRPLWIEATARRYIPYFELWTIWGFFSPVGYNEAELQVGWSPLPGLLVNATGGLRRYHDATAVEILSPLEEDAKRLSVRASWTPVGAAWSAHGGYTVEDGFGAFLSSGDASVRWNGIERLSISLDGSAFQQIEQFRIGEGVVIGAGASADLELGARTTLSGGMHVYRQTFENRPSGVDWNQTRGWAALRIGFGRDPGLRTGGDR